MSIFRDPYIWGTISQGRWLSNSWTISGFTLVAPQDAGQQVLSVPSEEITPGDYRLHGGSISNCNGGSVRLILGDDVHPTMTDGPIDETFTVTSATNQLIGFKDVGDTGANITGPLLLDRV